MKIIEVSLHTHQFETMKSFYSTQLGLSVLDDQKSGLSLRAGDSILSFQEANLTERPFYHIAFTIPTNKFTEARQWIRERGIPLFDKNGQDEFTFADWNATAFYFYDPDGHLIKFIAHHTFDNGVDESFGSKYLLRISEIGLPVDDVPDAAKKFEMLSILVYGVGTNRNLRQLATRKGCLLLLTSKDPGFRTKESLLRLSKVSFRSGQSGSLRIQGDLYVLIVD